MPLTTSTPWSTADMPDLNGRTAVITGANTGLGLETARALAGRGAAVTLAVRSTAKGDAAADSIRSDVRFADVSVQALDLSSLESVRAAAAALNDTHDHIDLLINNAGVMYTPWQTTADGFEMQVGVNHLGHFAFTGLLLDRLQAADNARIVTVASVAHMIKSAIDVDRLNDKSGYDRVAAYGRSKLANLLFTYELQRRLVATKSNASALAAHPGVSATELGRNSPGFIRLGEKVFRPLLMPAAKGALPTLRAATDPAALGGQYFGPDGFREFRGDPVVVTSTQRSHDATLQGDLWRVSEDLTGVTYPI